MFNAVTEAQRDVITVVVFIVTFFVALGIGRFLKRRAGVQLGLILSAFLFNHSPFMPRLPFTEFTHHGAFTLVQRRFC